MQRLLLIEDSLPNQILVRAALQGLFHLDVASTLAEGRTLLEAQDYDLLLLDVKLPDGESYEFCQRLRADDVHGTLPVIFLTAHSELSERLRGFSAGGDDYITKPFLPREFVARINVKLKHAVKI